MSFPSFKFHCGFLNFPLWKLCYVDFHFPCGNNYHVNLEHFSLCVLCFFPDGFPPFPYGFQVCFQMDSAVFRMVFGPFSRWILLLFRMVSVSFSRWISLVSRMVFEGVCLTDSLLMHSARMSSSRLAPANGRVGITPCSSALHTRGCLPSRGSAATLA